MAASSLLWAAGFALSATGGAPRVPTGQPVRIEADRLVARRADREVRFHGNVRVRVGTLLARCEDLVARYDAGGREVQELQTLGRTVIDDEGRRAVGTGLTYRRDRRLLVLAGPAELTEGSDRVDGERMEFHLDEDRVVVLGARGRYRPRSGDVPGLEGIAGGARGGP